MFSSEAFVNFFEHAPIAFAIVSPESKFLKVNPAFCQLLGYNSKEIVGSHFLALTHPEDALSSKSNVKLLIQQKIPSFSLDKRYLHKDGSYVLCNTNVTLRRDSQGAPKHFIVNCFDIREKKKAEDQLRKASEEKSALAKKLICIQEEERKRIALEIHDELGQILSTVKMTVGHYQNKNCLNNSPLMQFLNEVTDLVDHAFKTIRKISSELRPPLLDHLGLCDAVEFHAKKTLQHSNIEPLLSLSSLPEKLSDQISLALFRIFQEALNNVCKHSRAHKVHIVLKEIKCNILLEVIDDGIGFHAKAKEHQHTLGLIGMKERATSLNGSFTIIKRDKLPGTHVRTLIPFPKP